MRVLHRAVLQHAPIDYARARDLQRIRIELTCRTKGPVLVRALSPRHVFFGVNPQAETHDAAQASFVRNRGLRRAFVACSKA